MGNVVNHSWKARYGVQGSHPRRNTTGWVFASGFCLLLIGLGLFIAFHQDVVSQTPQKSEKTRQKTTLAPAGLKAAVETIPSKQEVFSNGQATSLTKGARDDLLERTAPANPDSGVDEALRAQAQAEALRAQAQAEALRAWAKYLQEYPELYRQMLQQQREMEQQRQQALQNMFQKAATPYERTSEQLNRLIEAFIPFGAHSQSDASVPPSR